VLKLKIDTTPYIKKSNKVSSKKYQLQQQSMYRKRLIEEEKMNKEEYLTLSAREQYKWLIDVIIDSVKIATKRSIGRSDEEMGRCNRGKGKKREL